MPSTTGYNRGDVVLVPFPFTDLSSLKQRPALVISSDAFNTSHPDIIVMAITSQIPLSLATDEFLISQNELQSGGLLKLSILKLGKIVTLHQRLVVKRIGILSSPTMEKILGLVRAQF